MNLTKVDVIRAIRFGDTVIVHYHESNVAARVLAWFEKGHGTHELNCLGGLDIVEETIGGGMRTSLYTYLRGNCDLTIKRAPRALTLDGVARIRQYWLGLVGGGYGWDSIRRAAITVPIRRYVKPRWPRVARVLTSIARVLLPGNMVDCSASWVAGIRLDQPVLVGYDPQEVTPETTLRDAHLITVARWKSPLLVD